MPGEERAPRSGKPGWRDRRRVERARERERERRDLTLRLGRSVFVTRHFGILALILACLTIPGFGDNRDTLVIALATIVLPYNAALHLETKRAGRVPGIMVFTDQLLSALFPLIAIQTWVPSLIIVSCETALAVSVFGLRRALAGLALGCSLLTAVGLQQLPADDVAVGVLAYAIGGIMLAITVGVVSNGERRLHRRYTELVAGVDAIVWEADVETMTFSYVSEAAERMFGHSLTEWREPGFLATHVVDDDRALVHDFFAGAPVGSREHALEHRIVAADGSIVWVQSVVRGRSSDGDARSLRGVMFDITDRKRAEADVLQYGNIIEGMPLGLVTARLVDGELVLVAANPAVADLLGVDADELVGRPVQEVFPSISQAALPRLCAVAEGADAFDLDAVNDATADPDRVIALRAFPLADRAVGIALDDVTGTTMTTAALRRRATHDDLTGLPNRVLLRDRLRQALHEAARTSAPVALMILDLDQFKEVNDALGHQYGDLLLIEVGQRLERIVRDCDTIARLGGDEFALLLTTDATTHGALRVAEKVSAALQLPFEIEGIALQTNASIGIALYPKHADTAESLTQRADVAMYAAKRSGSRLALYVADDDRSSISRLTLLGEIRQAVHDGHFAVLYQPVLDLASGDVIGAEALVRWRHPERGVLDPAEFIEIAEVSGVIRELTRAVISQTVRDLASWRARGIDLRVSVNLSVRNLYDADLLPWLRSTLQRAGVPASSLAVELTESQLMEDTAMAMDVLSELRRMGIGTAIDDFGTGYSSLAYLRDLPIVEVKIDRSFITELLTDEGELTIVQSIIDLAHGLGLDVLAEGVEDEAAIAVLRDLGCDRVQGFAVGRPMSGDDLTALVAVTPAAVV